MKILFTCGRELDYPRNFSIFQLAHKSNQVTFIGHKTGRKSILQQSIINGIKILPHLRSSQYSLSIFGFYGHLILLFAGRFARQPILFDVFISTYDTLCFDRKVFKPDSIPGLLAKWVDIQACSQADRIILDTRTHATYFNEILGIPEEKLDTLYVGCNEDLFYPRPEEAASTPLVLFYGSLLPLHNIDVIIKAAQETQKYGVQFLLIGPFNQKSISLDLPNVKILPPVPERKLPEYIALSTICLGGHFGSSEKAGRVIAGKTFQCIAMGKPTVVGDNPANRELLTHGFDAWFCKMNDADALADSIMHLIDNKIQRSEIGANAYQTYQSKASTDFLERKFEKIIQKTLNSNRIV